MSLSPQQFLALERLITAMNQANEEIRGVRVKVPLEQVAFLKRGFYQLKNEPCFDSLSLLSTADPSEFLIYHQAKEIPNG